MAEQPNMDDLLKKAAEKAAANPNVMFEAFKATHLAYAFQFAMTAKPRYVTCENETLQERLNLLHESKALVLSVTPYQSGSGQTGYLIFFYAKE